jgi:hypothetical protein
MHSRTIDLARVTTAACWRDDAPAQDDGRKVSALWWVVPTFGLWVALIAWWLS